MLRKEGIDSTGDFMVKNELRKSWISACQSLSFNDMFEPLQNVQGDFYNYSFNCMIYT